MSKSFYTASSYTDWNKNTKGTGSKNQLDNVL